VIPAAPILSLVIGLLADSAVLPLRSDDDPAWLESLLLADSGLVSARQPIRRDTVISIKRFVRKRREPMAIFAMFEIGDSL